MFTRYKSRVFRHHGILIVAIAIPIKPKVVKPVVDKGLARLIDAEAQIILVPSNKVSQLVQTPCESEPEPGMVRSRVLFGAASSRQLRQRRRRARRSVLLAALLLLRGRGVALLGWTRDLIALAIRA